MNVGPLLRPAGRLAAGLSAAAVRILLIFAVLLVVCDAVVRLGVQVAPASWWFEVSRVEILHSGTVTIVYRQSRSGDLPISSIVELLGPNGEQPCASSGRRVIESDTTFAVAPIQRLLPDCRWSQFGDGDYYLSLTVSYVANGMSEKTVTRRSSNAIIVRGGSIVGATTAERGG